MSDDELPENGEPIPRKRVGDVLRELNVEMFRKELHVPEVLKKDVKDLSLPDSLKKEITVPEALKKEIPVGDFLGKEIHIRRRKDTIEQLPCPTCGRPTPSTVSHCLHCEAPIERVDSGKSAACEEELAPIHLDEGDTESLIDLDW